MKLKYLVLFTLSLLILSVAFPQTEEEGFGKNKVQYRGHNWRVYETDKLSIIYYEGSENLALFARDILEAAYKMFEDALAYTPKIKVPIIIYRSHNDFEQTNITPYIIEESVGGFTEMYKNRVVVPFTGSYEDFRHVLVHELTHFFQFNILYGPGVTSVISRGLFYEIPLWFTEGMAEYFSLNWNANTDMIMRDLIYYDNLLSIQELSAVGGYVIYKEGQSILKFIADRYGEKKIGEILHKITLIGGLGGAIKDILGISLKEFNELWKKSLKKKYWCQLPSKDEIPSYVRRLTQHKGYAFNVAPAISPDGSKIAFLSDRNQYENMYLMSTIDGKVRRRLVRGGKSSGFESLHIGYGGITWAPSGKEIAFIAKGKGKDWIYIKNVKKRKIVKKFSCDVDAIFSPSWSPTTPEIAFRGVKNGQADIYVLNINTGNVTAVTNDIYDDITPSWSPDGAYLIFASDRPSPQDTLSALAVSRPYPNWHYGLYTLFIMKKNGSSITQTIDERASYVAYPSWVEDRIFFISNRNGTNNLYALNMGTNEAYQITDLVGGVFTPSISSDGQYIAFSLYIKYGWDIFVAKIAEIDKKESTEPISFPGYYIAIKDDSTGLTSKKLGLRISPDFVIGEISYGTGYGFVANTAIAISDILGDHRLYIISDSPYNLIESNLNIIYWYAKKRINMGVGIFREKYYYVAGPNTLVSQQFLGSSLLLSYPFDIFRRVELGIDAYSIKYQDHVYHEDPLIGGWWEHKKPFSVPIFSPYIAYVRDNVIWGFMGPVNGERSRIRLLSTVPVFGALRFNYFELDHRKYIRITPGYTMALKLLNANVWGKNVDVPKEIHVDNYTYSLTVPKLRIGGIGTLRGYDYGEFEGKNVGLLNLEFRYPFIDYFKVSFPLSLVLQGIRGALFLDLGYAKDNMRQFKLFDNGKLADLKVGFGMGIRFRLSYLILKLDIAKHTDLSGISRNTYYHFSFGSEY